MRSIIESSMRLRYLIVILAAALMVFGIAQIRSMPVDVFPEFNPPMVEIQTEALGLSAEEVESLITTPMEADLLIGVAWLDRIYSESVTGLSSITLVFERDADPIQVRQMVQERLNQTYALPNVSKPPTMIQPLSSTNRVMMIGLSSQDLSLIDMGVLARWNIRPRLMGVPGVANVAVWGQRERQLQVQVDPQELQKSGVTVQQVIETTGEALWVSPLTYLESSSPGTAGWIDTPNQRLGIHHLLPITSAEDLGRVSVVGSDGLVLSDVANVIEDHQPLIGDAVINDGPGLLLVVEKFPGANTLQVTEGIEDALTALQPGLTGLTIDPTVFRPANYIEAATNNVSTAMMIGGLLVVLILGAFFFKWRTALVSLVVIPLSLVAAGFVLSLRDVTFNAMILAGLVIALGAIIDDAIIDVENIARRLRENRKNGLNKPTMAVIADASMEMRGNIGFATLIILLAMLPVFFMQGVSASFFHPLAVSYMLAVLASVAVAMVVTPALSLLLLENDKFEQRESPLVSRLKKSYGGSLSQVINTRYFAPVMAGIIILAGLAVLPFLGVSLNPALKQTDLLIKWEGAPGTSLTEMNRIMGQAGQELRTIPGVRNVGSHVGRAETGDQTVGINSAEIWVNLDRAADYDATLAAVQKVIDGYPGLQREVGNYEPKRLGEALATANDELVVRLYGHDLAVLKESAQSMSKTISEVTGVVNAQPELPAEEAQVEIEVNLVAAEQYGLKPGDVRRSVATLLSGLRVGSLYEEQKVFEVVVWGVPEIRNSLNDIGNLLIDTPSGEYVRLGDVADVRVVPTPIIVRRDSVSRFMDITVSVSGRSLTAVAADIKSRLAEVEVPFEYHAELLGGYAEQQAAQQRMLILAVAAVIGFIVLLQASFKSWRLSFAALLTLPMALAGGVLATVVLGGGILSIGSLFGFFTVLGLAIRNGIVMTNHFDRLERVEGTTFGPELVLRGASERLAPILMTVLTTALAMLPVVILGDIPGLEIIRPMAIVVLGGLVTTTLLDLFVLPALYLLYGASREQELDLLPVTAVGEA
jgi:CzcA family heavy metal efflux pump